MLFKKGTVLYAYEILREAGQDVMDINYLGSLYVPNIADSPEVMARTVDSLIESPNVSRIVFVQQRNYNYDFPQTSLLLEISQLYTYLMRQERILSPEKLVLRCQQCLGKRHNDMTYFINLLKQDPIAAYFEVTRFLREERILLDRIQQECKTCQMAYARLLEKIIASMENLTLI